MKKYLNYPIVNLKSETYLTLIIFLSPLLYFLSGINVDIYSPSMPTIASYFHASIVATKNTISMTILGWAIGGLTFGILIDSIGRKKVLLFGMFLYVIFSAVAPFCESIREIMLVRFIQGFSISSIVGARVLILDLFTGRRYMIAILYTSLGYGLGPIVGPFIGGLLQYYFDWQANFIALAIVSFIILFLLFVFVKESIVVRHPLKFQSIIKRCASVFTHKKFMIGAIIGGITQIQLMLYPTIGPFIVEKTLHQTVLVYGNSALMVGAAYLTGNLINRFMQKYLSPKHICDVGFLILIIATAISFLFSFISTLELTTVMLPIFLTSMSAGFIFPNVLGANLKQFAHTPGIAMAVQSSVLLLAASAGIFLISHVPVKILFELAMILGVMGVAELLLFYGYYRSVFLET